MIITAIFPVDFISEFRFELVFTLISFAIAFIPYSYMCGFLFKKANSALKVFPVVNFFIGYLAPFSVLGILAGLY